MVCVLILVIAVLFFKQKTAYEMRISYVSSDVCSSDLNFGLRGIAAFRTSFGEICPIITSNVAEIILFSVFLFELFTALTTKNPITATIIIIHTIDYPLLFIHYVSSRFIQGKKLNAPETGRSEEHTSELQSLMRI